MGDRLMGKFKWGATFKQMNAALFERYSRCQNNQEVLEVQNQWMAMIEEENALRQQAKLDRSQHHLAELSSSDQEEDSDEDSGGSEIDDVDNTSQKKLDRLVRKGRYRVETDSLGNDNYVKIQQ